MARTSNRRQAVAAAHSCLDAFLPPVRDWFRSAFGEPTPPQKLGWPRIWSGENALIVAPTGSGKTLAAFLAALDHLWRSPEHGRARGVRVLYLSPLKALNHDIARNLERPLQGILATAETMGYPLRPLQVGVRTGDTSTADRQRMIRRPPDILITTPESLHLMLTGQARHTLATVQHVIVDEIHAVCGNKRGVFLSLLLERLAAITEHDFVRIGLSATQRPLDLVARFLGGRRHVSGTGVEAVYEARPVSIVDAGQRKDLDLVVSMPSTPGLASASVWPAIESELLELVRRHRSTIVFANNRRVVERVAANLNERAAVGSGNLGCAEEDVDSPEDPPAEDEPIARPHHGSLSLDVRRGTEAALKEGRIPAVIATASLEMGIDMGAVELVCQVESPGGVGRALQRVGRAGHVVGQVSRGRIFAKSKGDLLEAAALARAMLAGDVELLRTPANCLDVLAQQVVAWVSLGPIETGALYDRVRQAAPYADLTPAAFDSVLEMISGRFGVGTFRDLTPRVSWDRVHGLLRPLPGTQHRAMVGGGTIPDTGHYPVYLGDGGPRLGELDEEFVFERRVGEAFRLGQGTWRIEAIEPHRVLVVAAAGRDALVPFWRGEAAGRTRELGLAVGRLTRFIRSRLDGRLDELVGELMRECCLDERSARRLVGHVSRQQAMGGAVPDDRTVQIEVFRDEAGELSLAILSPLGARHNLAIKLIVVESLRRRLGIDLAALHNNDGVLIRLPGMDEPPLDLFQGIGPNEAEAILRESLGESALFGLRFRQNAGRALLMPRPDINKRTPLWLQRLRARDLLQAVRRFPGFPIVVETYRECLSDDLDLENLRAFFAGLADGSIRCETRVGELPSPFVSELVFEFSQKYLYEWDEPRRGDRPRSIEVDESLLDGLLALPSPAAGIDADAVARVEARLRGVGRPPRTTEEMAEWLLRLGDLASAELAGPMQGFLGTLEQQGRACRVSLDVQREPDRWIAAEERARFEVAFGCDPRSQVSAAEAQTAHEARKGWIARYVSTRALVNVSDLVDRYPIDAIEASILLDELVTSGMLVNVANTETSEQSWADSRNLEQVRRLTIALRRQESVAVAPEVFADLVARLQFVHPAARVAGEPKLDLVLERLEGLCVPLEQWETEVLPRRVGGFRSSWLDTRLTSGAWTCQAIPTRAGEPRVGFFAREFRPSFSPGDEQEAMASSSEQGQCVLSFLAGRGACRVATIAQGTGLSPAEARSVLTRLFQEGRVSPDRLDGVRPDDQSVRDRAQRTAGLRVARARLRLGTRRQAAQGEEEPRWSAPAPVVGTEADAESREDELLEWASRLLERLGVLTRETVALEPAAPPWRDLVPPLSRAELRDEVRRGYFVEGLSGVQFALPETVAALGRAVPAPSAETLVLLSSVDPANLYGSGAPFDIPLLEGGTARLIRQPSNFLVLAAGRPVLVIEAHGKRLTGLRSASDTELRHAIGLVASLAGPGRRRLRVELYNGRPAQDSDAAEWLASAGFHRDLGGMTFYAGW